MRAADAGAPGRSRRRSSRRVRRPGPRGRGQRHLDADDAGRAALPNRWRRGPLSLVATMPPIVARSPNGGSSGSHCRSRASAAFTSRSVAPAGAVATRSPAYAPAARVSRADGRSIRSARARSHAPAELRPASVRRPSAMPAVAAAGASIAAAVAASMRLEIVGSAGHQNRSARPAASTGMLRGTARAPRRTAAASGSTLPGLQMFGRVERAAHQLHRVEVDRRRTCPACSAFLSAPTPCSPVIEPPASMQ